MNWERVEHIAAAMGSVGAFLTGLWNRIHIKKVHVTINSRMDELLRQEKELGRVQGVDEERTRADKEAK